MSTNLHRAGRSTVLPRRDDAPPDVRRRFAPASAAGTGAAADDDAPPDFRRRFGPAPPGLVSFGSRSELILATNLHNKQVTKCVE